MDALYWNTYHGISKKNMYDLGYCTPILRDPQESSLDSIRSSFSLRRHCKRVASWAEAEGVGRRLGRKSLQQLAFQDVTNLGRQLVPRWKWGNLKMWNRNLGHFIIIFMIMQGYL